MKYSVIKDVKCSRSNCGSAHSGQVLSTWTTLNSCYRALACLSTSPSFCGCSYTIGEAKEKQ